MYTHTNRCKKISLFVICPASAIRHQTRPPTLVRTSINSSCTQLQLTQQEVHTAIVRRQRAMGVLLNPLVVATLAVMMSATWTLTAGYSAAERVARNTVSANSVTSCPQMEVLRGRDGVPGTPGRDGSQGRDGRDGGKGEKGDAGTVGATGPPGEKGGQGTAGPSGLPGPPGPSGISGPRGTVGERGDRGSTGLPGPQGEQGAQGPPTGGAVYTRWGRTSCPSGQGTELVYSGRAGGSHHHKHGGAANLLCLPNDPEYSTYNGASNYVPLRGAEYRAANGQPFRSVSSHNMPCAVCYASTRDTVLMIPAKQTCPTHWTTEYTGYLVAAPDGHNGRTLFECIDQQPQSVPGLNGGDGDNAFYYHVEATCNSLSCPPYDTRKEVTCVVCSR